MHEVVNKIITETQNISLAKAFDHKAHLYIYMFTTLCIDCCFQDCTETQKRLFFSYSAIGKLWIGLTGVDAVFGSCCMLF